MCKKKRDTVDVARADWATGHSLEESYHSAEIQSVYSVAQANWATWHLLEESYPSAEIQSVYSTASADWAIGHLLEESYQSAEIQSVFSVAQDDWPNKEENNRYLDFVSELKNIWKKKLLFTTIKRGSLLKNSQRPGKDIRGSRYPWKDWNFPNYDIVEIGKDTLKSPRELRRLAVCQTLVEDTSYYWYKNLLSVLIKMRSSRSL